MIKFSKAGLAVALFAGLCACGSDGLSTAEMQEAAKERVRTSAGLAEGAALFTNVFVGEELDGDPTLCGTVAGRTADGTAIAPRRFIAATEPARWVKFEPATSVDLPSQPDMFVEWRNICRGEG